ncbi:MAG: hypothetical protein ACOX9C_01870 [Kiritimatiellia bacterium]|jgi:hypothetical protein
MKRRKSNLPLVCRGAICTAMLMFLSSRKTYYRPDNEGWYEFKAIPGKVYQVKTKYREGDVVGPIHRSANPNQYRTAIKASGVMSVYVNGVLWETEQIEEVKIGLSSTPYWWITALRFLGEAPVTVKVRFDGDLGKFVEEHGGISLRYPPLK